MYGVGLMSGTSLDGVDACLVEIKKHGKNRFIHKKFSFLPFDKKFKSTLLNVVSNKEINIQLVCSLNVQLSSYYVKAVKKLLADSEITKRDIDFIAMHGQTVWHNPNHKDGFESSTLQLGDPSVVAAAFGCKVISNFRAADMAVGGEGAPLVPFANYILYSNPKKNIALQNIGGISNVTYLKAGGTIDDIIAFDTGPGNMLIDGAMRRLFRKDFDEYGATAKMGKVIKPALDELMKDVYLDQAVPKSTGREKYNDNYLSEAIMMIRSFSSSDYDIIATLTAYTAECIAYEYKKFLGKVDKLIVSGGGALNETLLEMLRTLIPCKIEVHYNSDSLEAFSFAILGYYTINKMPSNVPSVTGAKKRVVLGSITDLGL